jgi:hypothetical protein
MVMGERELREIEACCMLRDELHGKGRTRNHRDCSTWLARKQEPQREEMQKRGWPRRENFRGARRKCRSGVGRDGRTSEVRGSVRCGYRIVVCSEMQQWKCNDDLSVACNEYLQRDSV